MSISFQIGWSRYKKIRTYRKHPLKCTLAVNRIFLRRDARRNLLPARCAPCAAGRGDMDSINIWNDRYAGKRKAGGVCRIAALPVMVLCAWMALRALSEKIPEDTLPAEPPQEVREEMPQSGMFEWDEDSILRIDEAAELAKRLRITHWYQEIEFSQGMVQELAAFIEAMAGQGVKVYALVGAKEWGYEPDGASLIAYMENVRIYNESVSQNQRLWGIMADVEPYILKGWKDNAQANMDAYVSGMVKAHEWTLENDLLLIACIPRHYDDQGLSEQLERLIAQGCDEVAVMNYGCGDEVERIKTEALLAVRYGKPLHCILEFQEVGKHGLTEEETYRNKGLEAAWEVWTQVEEACEGVQFIRDYHWTEPIWDILAQEAENE